MNRIGKVPPPSHNPYAPPTSTLPETRFRPPPRGWLIPIITVTLAVLVAIQSQAWDSVAILVVSLLVVCVLPWYSRIEDEPTGEN